MKDTMQEIANRVDVFFIASSEESVGEFGEGEVAEVVITGGFVGVLSSKAVGFSGDQFQFVVEALDKI